MQSGAFSPVARAVSMLASVALVGGLIGLGWEQALYEPSEAADLEPVALPGAAPAPGPRRERPLEEEAVLQRVLSHFPPYPRGSRPEVLAADYLGSKAPIAAVWLTTGDAPDDVLEHYRQVLEDQGLPAIGQRYNSRAGFVGYWNPESEEVFLVSTLAQGGETLVFVSTAQVAALLEDSEFVPGWFPLPARLEEPMALSLALEGTTQHTASGRIPAASLKAGIEDYLSVLEAQGWTVEAQRQSRENEVELEIRRERIQGTASLKRTPPASHVQLFLSLQERR